MNYIFFLYNLTQHEPTVNNGASYKMNYLLAF